MMASTPSTFEAPDIHLAAVVGEDPERDQRPAANNWAVVPPQEQQVRAALVATVEVQ
jgi:hypothetical protein